MQNQPEGKRFSFRRRKWQWSQIDCNLRTSEANGSLIWSLVPSLIFTHPTQKSTQPHAKLCINMERSFEVQEQLGWIWHKSWNIPNMSVRIEIKDQVTGESYLPPKDIYAHIFAVRVVEDQNDQQFMPHLVDVGLYGDSKVPVVEGQAYFTSMRFLSTTSMNEGSKIFLLLVLYIKTDEPDTPPKVLIATLSPPFFVDCGNTLRQYEEKKFQSITQPFITQLLDKEYIKIEHHRRGGKTQIKINNDFQGLLHYVTAVNIKYKIRHPIFLALKFSKCCKLFYNKNMIEKKPTLIELMNLLQKQLFLSYNKKDRHERRYQKKIFLMLIEDTLNRDKERRIREFARPLKSKALSVTYHQESVPPYFQNISVVGNLNAQYRRNISKLCQIAKHYTDKMNANCTDGPLEFDSDYGSDSDQPAKRKRFKFRIIESESSSDESSSISEEIIPRKNQLDSPNISEEKQTDNKKIKQQGIARKNIKASNVKKTKQQKKTKKSKTQSQQVMPQQNSQEFVQIQQFVEQKQQQFHPETQAAKEEHKLPLQQGFAPPPITQAVQPDPIQLNNNLLNNVLMNITAGVQIPLHIRKDGLPQTGSPTIQNSMGGLHGLAKIQNFVNNKNPSQTQEPTITLTKSQLGMFQQLILYRQRMNLLLFQNLSFLNQKRRQITPGNQQKTKQNNTVPINGNNIQSHLIGLQGFPDFTGLNYMSNPLFHLQQLERQQNERDLNEMMKVIEGQEPKPFKNEASQSTKHEQV